MRQLHATGGPKAMKHLGSISLVCSMVILGVFLGSAHGSYTHGIALVTKTILFASMAVNLLAIVLNLGSRAAIVALFVSLAGLGAVGSIVDHL